MKMRLANTAITQRQIWTAHHHVSWNTNSSWSWGNFSATITSSSAIFLLSLLHSSNATFVIFCQPQMEIWKSEAWELIKTANNYVKRSAVQSSFRFTPIVSLLLRDVLIFLNYQKCNFCKALCMSLCLWTLILKNQIWIIFWPRFLYIKWHIR